MYEVIRALLTWLLAVMTVSLILNSVYYKRRELFERMGLEVHPWGVFIKKPITLGFAERLPKRLMKALFSLGVFVFIYLLYKFYEMFVPALAARIVGGSSWRPLLTPLIPGVTVSWELLVYVALGFVVGAFVHELAHGIAARIEGVPVRSTGVALILYMLPAAFVEPDENEFRRLNLSSKLRILSAGIAANALLALVALAALLAANPTVKLAIIDVNASLPAAKAGLQPGDVIVYVNSTELKGVETLRAIIAASNVVNITVERNGRLVSFLVKPAVVNGVKVIGVVVKPLIPQWLLAIYWLFIANQTLALINAAPLVITDGARILSELLSRFGDVGRGLWILVQIVTFVVLIGNIGVGRIG